MNITNILSKRNRVLLRELVVTDFKLRYQGSVLGYLWSLLKPLFLFAITYTVFGLLVKLGSVPHYAVYLLLGIVLWTFFSEATNQGLGSIIGRGDVLRKISFPKYIIVLSTTISALINLTFNLVIFFIIAAFNGVLPGLGIVWLIGVVIEIYIFALGLALFLSALTIKYRDTAHIWEIIMQAAFYATPIIYTLDIAIKQSPTIAKLLLLNPVAQAMQDARYHLVTHETKTFATLYAHHIYVIIPLAVTVLTLIGGALYFKKNSPYFAERV